MRKLASIQRITNLSPIKGADKIEVASILGWNVIVKKGQHSIGDLCCYLEIDSVLPQRPEFEFLRERKFRIKTIKLKGQISQGICFPLVILPEGTPVEEGLNVTDQLGVKKYEIPIPPQLKGVVKGSGSFLSYVPKTDEVRIQSYPKLLEELNGKPFFITEKVDGTSVTFAVKDKEFNVCSRNLALQETEDNLYWKIARKYKIQEFLIAQGNYAIQGEIAGPGIQSNRLGLTEHSLFIFNVFDINNKQYLNYKEFAQFCSKNNLPVVKTCYMGDSFNFSLEELLILSKGKYPSGHEREGIVVRPSIETFSFELRSRLSFKVVNNDYLLKINE